MAIVKLEVETKYNIGDYIIFDKFPYCGIISSITAQRSNDTGDLELYYWVKTVSSNNHRSSIRLSENSILQSGDLAELYSIQRSILEGITAPNEEIRETSQDINI